MRHYLLMSHLLISFLRSNFWTIFAMQFNFFLIVKWLHSHWILSIDETVLSVSSGDIERCLGSEGEDEGSVWGMEVLDSRDAQDKISLTASEGTEPGSPAPCALSPPAESWIHTQNTPRKDPEHCDGSMFSKSLWPTGIWGETKTPIKTEKVFTVCCYTRIFWRTFYTPE